MTGRAAARLALAASRAFAEGRIFSEATAGQTWAERYVVQIPAIAPPQTVYTLVAGLYDPASGVRLTTADGKDRVILTSVNVP